MKILSTGSVQGMFMQLGKKSGRVKTLKGNFGFVQGQLIWEISIESLRS